MVLERGVDVKPGSSSPRRRPDADVHGQTAELRDPGCCSPKAQASARSSPPVLQRHIELRPVFLRWPLITTPRGLGQNERNMSH